MREEQNDSAGPADLTPAERELEMALSGLKPAGGELGRDELLRLSFRAGRSAGAGAGGIGDAGWNALRRQVFMWRAAAAVLLVGCGLAVATRTGPVRERVIE